MVARRTRGTAISRQSIRRGDHEKLRQHNNPIEGRETPLCTSTVSGCDRECHSKRRAAACALTDIHRAMMASDDLFDQIKSQTGATIS
jgi:hypothetical protein